MGTQSIQFKKLICSAVVFVGNLVVVIAIEIQEHKVSFMDRKRNFVNINKLVTQKRLHATKCRQCKKHK